MSHHFFFFFLSRMAESVFWSIQLLHHIMVTYKITKNEEIEINILKVNCLMLLIIRD